MKNQIDSAYIIALYNLIRACRDFHVELNTVQTLSNGFRVTFKGFDGDAICHDYSYGSPCYGNFGDYTKIHHNDWDWSKDAEWETIGFPWDYDDVSVHTAIELVSMISALQNGRDWTIFENSD